jgi:hypothetical protein
VLLLEKRNLARYFAPEFRRKRFTVNYCAQCSDAPEKSITHYVKKALPVNCMASVHMEPVKPLSKRYFPGTKEILFRSQSERGYSGT